MKITVFIALWLIGTQTIAQTTEKEKWVLPIHNELVFYKDSKSIPTERKELCEYFFSQAFYKDVVNKLNAAAINSEEKNLAGNTSYSYKLKYNNAEFGSNSIYKCNPDGNDTIKGKLDFIKSYESRVVTNGQKRTITTSVNFMVNIIFMNNQDCYVSLKGLSLNKEDYKPGWNKHEVTDEYLAEAYDKFIKSKTRSKDDKELFASINEMAELFYSTFFKALQMHVRVMEAD
jgi:hypothetical protein